MAKKIRYYYDHETCSFKEEKIGIGEWAKRVFSYLSVSGLIACILLAVFVFAYGDPKYALLENQNKKLLAKIDQFELGFAQLEQQVDSLQRRDSELYRSIMDVDPIEQGVWNGGSGGAANVDHSDPQVLKKAKQRLDILTNKLSQQFQSYDLLSNRFSNMKDELSRIPSIKPVPGRLISSYGMRMHPIHKIRKRHTGIDLQATTGTQVYATGDGKVKFSGVRGNGYGIYVDLDHGYGYVTKYAHLSKVLVKKGQKVKRGDVIGLSGNTGLSKGPHLHYEIIKNGVKINPIDYFYSDLTPEEYVSLKKEAMQDNESMD